MFADDTKLYRQIKSEEDVKLLQEDLDKLQNWSNKWLLKFHPNKCKVISIKASGTRKYYMTGQGGDMIQLENITHEKDIGVTIDEDLNFKTHIHNILNRANSLVGLIRRSFIYLDESMFKLLFKSLVRPHLEYAASVWNPYKIADIELIENVQRRASKLIPGFKGTSTKT